jgi:hypothetical protein
MGLGEDGPNRSDQPGEDGDVDLDVESEDLNLPEILQADGVPVGGVPSEETEIPTIPLLPMGAGGFVVPEGANVPSWETRFKIPGVIDPEPVPTHSHSETASCKEGVTSVGLDNVDEVVDEIMIWLQQDILSKPERFLGRSYESSRLLELADDQFFAVCKKVIKIAIEERKAMDFGGGEVPFIKDACTILVYELFRTRVFHRNHKRGDGSEYFYTHLVGVLDGDEEALANKDKGALYLTLRVIGLCGLSSMLGAFKHDDIEDMQEVNDENLLDVGMYIHRFEDVDPVKIQNLIERSVHLVRGVTKVSKLDDLETISKEISEELGVEVKFNNKNEAPFFRFLFEMKEDIRVAFIKFADRFHNMMTLDAKKGGNARESNARTIKETYEVYLPLARLMEVYGICEPFVDELVKRMNPMLYRDFHSVRASRIFSMQQVEKDVYSDVRESCSREVCGVEFVPYGLEYYTKRVDKHFDNLFMDDFKINSMDPMQELLITVNDPEDIGKVHWQILAALDISGSEMVEHLRAPTTDSKTHWLTPTGTFTRKDDKAEGVDGGDAENESYDELLSSFVQRGLMIKGFSKKYRRQFKIRINDKRSEHRRKRGVGANAQNVKAPSDILEKVERLLNLKINNTDVDILEEARDSILRPQTCFKTPHGDLRMLPKGASFREAAHLVHSHCGVTLFNTFVSRSNTADTGEVIHNNLDPVPFVPLDSYDVPVFEFSSPIMRIGGFNKKNLFVYARVCPLEAELYVSKLAKDQLEDFFDNPYAFFNIKSNQFDRENASNYYGAKAIARLKMIFGDWVSDFLHEQTGLKKAERLNSAVGTLAVKPFKPVLDQIGFDDKVVVGLEKSVGGMDPRDSFHEIVKGMGFEVRPYKYSKEFEPTDGVNEMYVYEIDLDVESKSRVKSLMKEILRMSYAMDGIRILDGITVKA